MFGTPILRAPVNAFCSWGERWYFVMPLYFTPRFPKVRPPRKAEETYMTRSLLRSVFKLFKLG